MADTDSKHDHSRFDSTSETCRTLVRGPSSRPGRDFGGGPRSGKCPAFAVGPIAVARQFLRDTKAGATAIAAGAVTVMTVGATAFVTDTAWLVDQRDLLKSAGNAAGVAATLELSRQLDLNPNIGDADLAAILHSRLSCNRSRDAITC